MERIGNTLGKVVRRLDRPEATLAWIASTWPQIVGTSLAAHTRPVRCRAGRLEILVDAPTWADQIHTLASEVCSRVNEAWGQPLVSQIEALVDPEPESPKDSDNRHTPFIRRSPK